MYRLQRFSSLDQNSIEICAAIKRVVLQSRLRLGDSCPQLVSNYNSLILEKLRGEFIAKPSCSLSIRLFPREKTAHKQTQDSKNTSRAIYKHKRAAKILHNNVLKLVRKCTDYFRQICCQLHAYMHKNSSISSAAARYACQTGALCSINDSSYSH